MSLNPDHLSALERRHRLHRSLAVWIFLVTFSANLTAGGLAIGLNGQLQHARIVLLLLAPGLLVFLPYWLLLLFGTLKQRVLEGIAEAITKIMLWLGAVASVALLAIWLLVFAQALDFLF